MKSTIFSKIIAILGIVGFIISVVIAVMLFQALTKAKTKLKDAAGNLRQVGLQYITYTAEINVTIPLETNIRITDEAAVNLRMNLDDSLYLMPLFLLTIR
jgi:hypothetical protein